MLSDDIVEMSLQYSTQWDSLAHVGALFDANGDGLPERVYYNGYRPNEHVVGPVDYDVGNGFAKTDLGQGRHPTPEAGSPSSPSRASRAAA